MKSFDSLIAGAGMWGCTLARRLAEAGRKVLVLEKRAAVGGNVRCETDAGTGIEIHTYGSHIFHTHLPAVWDFVNRFVTFNGYQHKVLASFKGKVYHLPLGLTLINKFFEVELKPGEVGAFLEEPVSDFMAERLRRVGDSAPYRGTNREALFEAFFSGYTCKQWGKTPEEIDPSVIRRVPVRMNYDTNYFRDYNQGIPLTGYNSLFERLLAHPNISVETEMTLMRVGTDLRAVRNPNSAQAPLEIDCGRPGRPPLPVYYSGPLDELFGYEFGALPWRTLRFERETLPMADYQGTSVVNYPDIDVPYTRIHEFKHYHPEPGGAWGFGASKTVIMREYSAAWKPGDEPYYPIANADSRALLARYQAEAAKLNAEERGVRLIVGGRLGGYKYFDMDKSVESALKLEI